MKRAVYLTVAVVAALAIVFVWRGRHKSDATVAAAGSARGSQLAPTAVERPAGAEPIANLPVLADDDPPGALRLEGSVLDAANHPVGGATVVLGANPPRTTTTETDGSFAFDNLVGRPYTLIARAPAGVAGPVTARLTDKSEPVVMHLRPAARLVVRVVGGDAKPIEGATVELRGNDLQNEATKDGVATFTTVVPGTYDVVAWAPGFARSHQQTRVVAGELTVRVMLAAGSAVSGRVMDDQGTPVGGARVVYVAASALRGAVDARLDGVTTAPDGGFRFPALAAGSVRFLATHPDHAAGTSALITLDGANEKTGVEVKLAPGAIVEGHVLDTQKQPVQGAQVRITSEAGRGGGGRRGGGAQQRQPARQAFTDAKGEFEIHGLPRGELLATANAEVGASSGTAVDTTAGDVRNVVITLDLTSTIAGTVVDLDGQPVEGAQVTAIQRPDAAAAAAGEPGPPPRRGGGGGNAQLTDTQGRFKITGLATGPYLIRASRSAQGGFGRRRGSDGTDAKAGDQSVRIVLPAEGGVKGKVAFADGSPPAIFSAAVGPVQQSFVGDAFELDGLPPGDYELTIRGPSFDTKVVDVSVDSGKAADLGTIALVQGRRLGGVVMSNGQPVAGATVYAGRQVMGSGASNELPAIGAAGGVAAGTKTDTTGPDGTFALAGFGDGDLTIIADLPSAGRSKAMLVGDDNPNPTGLVLTLLPYGSLSGTILQAGVPGAGVPVTVQSTTTPGAIYVVVGGPDGAYRFDNLAPDTYKVSATLRARGTIRFFSQQVDVPGGKEVVVNLTVDTGGISVVATPTSTKGAVGMGVGTLVTGALTAATAQQLSLRMAGAGAGASQVVRMQSGEPATFNEVTPGAYSVCIVPLPLEVTGGGGFGYASRHANVLPAFCLPVTVAATPDTQAIEVPVVVPAMIPDPGGTGGGGRTGGGTTTTAPK